MVQGCIWRLRFRPFQKAQKRSAIARLNCLAHKRGTTHFRLGFGVPTQVYFSESLVACAV
jgi:hypothetical protein